MQIIEVDGVGEVEFPDNMTDGQIQAILAAQFPPPPIDPTAGMSGADKFLAGVGKGFVDIGRGVGQLTGLMSQEEIDAAKALDAPLMRTGAGQIGNIVGNVAAAAPAMFIPGANTVVGAGLVGAGLGAAQPVATGESRLLNTGIGAAGGAGGQVAGRALAKYSAGKVTQAAASKAKNAVRDATAMESSRAGYVVPPDMTNPTATNRLMTGFAGKLTTQQAASAKNQEVTNALVRKTFGFADDAPLTPDTFAAFRESRAAPYKEIAALSDDAAAALEKLKQARFDAKEYWKFYNRSGNPEARATADAMDKTVDALEVEIEGYAKRAGKPNLVGQLKQARKDIAKAHQVEKALNETTGNVDARALSKSGYLTGDLKRAASFAKAFPKAAQSVEQMGAIPGVSPLDFVASGIYGGAGGMLAGPAGAGAAAIPLVRPLVRSAILSKPYQAMMATPSYGPGLIGRAAPALNNDAAMALSGLLGAGGSINAVQQ